MEVEPEKEKKEGKDGKGMVDAVFGLLALTYDENHEGGHLEYQECKYDCREFEK